jgi:hypothetical protein
MAKQKPVVLFEFIEDKITYKCEQILAATDTYAVYYDGKPINIKYMPSRFADISPRYKKSSFQNPGFAKNLARRLNTRYNTDKFTVVRLSAIEQIYP